MFTRIALPTICSAVFTLTACRSKSKDRLAETAHDTVRVRDTVYHQQEKVDWQKELGLTHDPERDSVWGHSVSYYLDDEACSGLASDLYYGILRPSDDGATFELMKLATTANSKLRPFYRWCLDVVIRVQDGALAEMTGEPARRYVEKFPVEFFDFINRDKTGRQYNEWASSIGYSGGYYYPDTNAIRNAAKLSSIMRNNCNNCSQAVFAQIDRFARDCFSHSE